MSEQEGELVGAWPLGGLERPSRKERPLGLGGLEVGRAWRGSDKE